MSLYEQLSARRKESQRRGETPPWVTTGGFQMYQEKLKYRNESMSDSFSRVAYEAAMWAVKRDSFGRGLNDLFDRFNGILYDGWLAPATPVHANMGLDRGLPVACSGSFIGDSINDFYKAYHEAAMLTKTGHGCSCYLGDIRPRGSSYGSGEGTADGVLPVIQQMLATVSTVSQGATRRGATAFYIPLSHGDIREVLDYHIANPKRLQIGYISDEEFESRCDAGDAEALAIWRRFLKVRAQTGKAYLLWTHKANRHAKELGIDFESDILASNLCTEIFLPSNPDMTFSCVISSVNLAKYREWEHDTLFLHDCILFLNAVTDSYLSRLGNYDGTERIRNFTEKYRALGLGALGFATFLQSERVAFESIEAEYWNEKLFSRMRRETRAAGDLYGNATVMAVAPNVSSALVCGGVSQGIEPFTSNVFTQETAAGDIYRMNPELLKLMKQKGIATEDNIQVIKKNNGSVLGNPLFTEEEQNIFKTAYEIDQNWIVHLANQRGKHIDQGQSVNLFFADNAPEAYVSEVHRNARKAPYVKSLYYLNTKVGVQGSTGECMMCAS